MVISDLIVLSLIVISNPKELDLMIIPNPRLTALGLAIMPDPLNLDQVVMS